MPIKNQVWDVIIIPLNGSADGEEITLGQQLQPSPEIKNGFLIAHKDGNCVGANMSAIEFFVIRPVENG
ncbi:hypothetical protein ACS25C_04000 [Dickeya undicola]|uniref:hypothetical protein n=1 Tax=Dickeya undicola TaxID=1577887 RepID=UPI003F24FF2F